MAAVTLRCFITQALREVLPPQEDEAFLARLRQGIQARLGAEAWAVLDYSGLDQPGFGAHRLETGEGPWDDPRNEDLAQELVIQAFNQLFC